MFHRLLALAVLAASTPAFAIDLADLTAFDLTGKTSLPSLSGAIKGRDTHQPLCLMRGVGAGAESGGVGVFEVVGGQLKCAGVATFTAQPVVYWANTTKFLWRQHTGAAVISSAVRFGRSTSGAEIIPCRPKGGGNVGTVGTFGGTLKCQAGPRTGTGAIPTYTEFDVLIRKSRDGA